MTKYEVDYILKKIKALQDIEDKKNKEGNIIASEMAGLAKEVLENLLKDFASKEK